VNSIDFSDAPGGGAGPLMWAQDALWRAIHASPPGDPVFSLVATWPGGDASVATVTAVLRRLVVRHGSLRSHYRKGPDARPWQYVLTEGSIPLEVEPYDDEDRLDAQRRPYDIGADWLVRPLLRVTADGRVRQVVIGISHMAVDGWSLHLLGREFRALLAAGPDAPLPAALQPLERVAFERSPAGRRTQERTLAHWSRTIAAAPEFMLRPMPGLSDETVTYDRIHSGAMAAAVRRVAARERVGTSTVLLGAVGLVLMDAGAADTCLLRIISATRRRPDTRNLIAAFNQEAAVLLRRGGTFGDYLRSVATAAITGYRHAEGDPERVGQVVERSLAARGIAPGGQCFFNDVRFPRDDDRVALADVPAAAPVPEVAAPTRIEALPPKVHAGAMCFASFKRLDAEALIRIQKDRRFLPEVSGQDLLLAIERLLVAA
jgi:hypothetical protein